MLTGACSLLPASLRADAIGLPVGIQLYLVHDVMESDAPGTLRKLYQIGFREVEAAGTGKYTPSEFRKLVADAGLRMPSAHFDMNIAELGPVFDTAVALGVKYVCNPSPPLIGPNQPPPIGESRMHALAERLNTIGRQAQSHGLQYCSHNLTTEFEKMPDGNYGFDLLARNTDPRLVSFELDCGWMYVAGVDPVAIMRKHPSRIKMLHIKDFKAKKPATLTMTGAAPPIPADLGTGYLDYKAVFAEGKRIGIEHCFAEQDGPFPVSSLSSAAAAYRFLHAAR